MDLVIFLMSLVGSFNMVEVTGSHTPVKRSDKYSVAPSRLVDGLVCGQVRWLVPG